MPRNQADLAVTAAVAVLASAAALAGAPTAVMVVLGIGLLAAPGYLGGEVLLGARVSGLERVAVAAGLALAVPVLAGLVLDLAGVPLHRDAWVGLLAVLTLAGDAVLLARRRTDRTDRAGHPAGEGVADQAGRAGRAGWPGLAGRAVAAWRAGLAGGVAALRQGLRERRLPIWPAAAFGAAVIIAAGGVGIARWGAAVQHYPGFTQLWLTPPGRHAPVTELGVSNHQGTTMRYWLVLDHGGHTTATFNLTLGDGQTWQRQVQFTGRSVITVNLYRLPDLAHPYRQVFASVGVGSRP